MTDDLGAAVRAPVCDGTLGREAAALLKLGLPVVGTQLAQIAMNFVDTVMAGNLSAQALAAVAVGGSLWMTASLFVLGTLLAVTASVSQLFGAAKNVQVGSLVRQALWMSQGLALLCFLAIRNADPILFWLHVDAGLIPVILGYVDAISWGLPAMCAFAALRCFSEGVSVTRPFLFIGLTGLLMNVGANSIFMYGGLGVPAMGAVGCGWASALVMTTMFLLTLGYLRVEPYYRRFGLFERFDWPSARKLTSLVRLGLPIGISVFLEASLFATVALLMGSLGTIAAASHQIAINVASITFMVPLGLSMAVTVRVGQAVGRGSGRAARRAGGVGVGLALGFMAVSAVTLLVFPGPIVRIYTNDPDVRQLASDLLLMAAIFQLSDGAQVAGSGALRGLKDTAVPMLITLVAYWGMGLPLGYLLGIGWSMGPRAIWVGFIAGLTIAAICLNFRFYRITRAGLWLASEGAVGALER